MAGRPRFDLDGVELADAERPGRGIIAVFRRRTTGGLVLLMPESADFLVPWEHVEAASIDLASGTLDVAFDASWAAGQNWLRGARHLVGRWTDRHLIA